MYIFTLWFEQKSFFSDAINIISENKLFYSNQSINMYMYKHFFYFMLQCYECKKINYSMPRSLLVLKSVQLSFALLIFTIDQFDAQQTLSIRA